MKLLLAAAAIAVLSVPVHAQTRKVSSAGEADCTARQGALPSTWSGQAYAIDGDTLAGVGLKPHIRIFGIQAPELRDATKGERVAGMRARAALEDLLEPAGHKVSCRVTKFDRYCRLVAQCSVDGTPEADLASALLAAGLAYGFYLDEVLPWEPRASQRYASAEAEARKQRRGLWKEWLGDK